MAGLLTNSERAQKRAEVAKLNEQAMSRFLNCLSNDTV